MIQEISGKPSPARECAQDGPTPAGRTRQSRRAEPAQPQGPACAGMPKSARPDQSSAPSRRAETLSQKGAMALAARLEAYWRAQGYPAARFWAEPIGERFAKVGTYDLYRVASNLVNGLPPRYAGDEDR